jgi:hypothetical protein
MATQIINLNDTTPAAPSDTLNVKWQADAASLDETVARNVSAYVPAATSASLGLVRPDDATIDVAANGVISVPVLTGDSGAGGKIGLVPAPAAGDAAAGKVLKADGTWYVPPWMSNPMSAEGDIIYGGASGTPTRLAAGTAGQLLQTNGSGAIPSWITPSSGSGGSVLFGTADPRGVALSLVQSKAGDGTYTSNTFSSAVTVGDLLVVYFHTSGGISASSVSLTDSLGTAYTLAVGLTGTVNNKVSSGIFYGIAPASGSNTVTAAGLSGWPQIYLLEFAGVQAVVDATASYEGTGTTSFLSLTLANSTDLVVSGVATYSSGSSFTASPLTIAVYNSGNPCGAVAYGVLSSGLSTITMSTSSSNSDFPLVAAAFKAVVSTPVSATEGALYFQTSSNPYTGYVYHNSLWRLFT